MEEYESTASKESQSDHQACSEIVFRLPPILNIETIEATAAAFKEIVIPERAVVYLDASATHTLTSPGLQMIIAVEKAMQSCGGALRLVGESENFSEILRFAGYAPQDSLLQNSNQS